MDPILATTAILAAAVALFVWNVLPVGAVAIGVSLALFATGVITSEQALAGFGDPVIIFIAALFVVSEGLDSTGVTAWAGQQLIDRGGANRKTVLTLVMLLVAVLSPSSASMAPSPP